MSEQPSVAEPASASRWSVEERAWKQELPDLPDEVIALLATPVVVTFAPVPPRRDIVRSRNARPARPAARIA
jgi:hypothetical protein